jgi:acetyl-CoA carboxylase carboxyltransferase component
LSRLSEIDELKRRKALALEMGGAERVTRQHDAGRLTVRERISRLLDRGSFREIGALAGRAEYDENGALSAFAPANCIFGFGRRAGARRDRRGR